MSEEREYGVKKASPSCLSDVGICSVVLKAQHNLRKVGSDTGPGCDSQVFMVKSVCQKDRRHRKLCSLEKPQKGRNGIAML